MDAIETFQKFRTPGVGEQMISRNRRTRNCFSQQARVLLISPAVAESFAKRLKNCRLVQLSSGIHYLQEDHPDVIGAHVKEWLIEVGIGSRPKQKLTL